MNLRRRAQAHRYEAVRVNVLYFAAARDAAGRPSETLELADGATCAAALEAAVRAHEGLARFASQLRFGVNESFAPPTHALSDGDTLALIPPVSGG